MGGGWENCGFFWISTPPHLHVLIVDIGKHHTHTHTNIFRRVSFLMVVHQETIKKPVVPSFVSFIVLVLAVLSLSSLSLSTSLSITCCCFVLFLSLQSSFYIYN